MNCDFSSSSSVFQSYQDNGIVTMKCCVQLNPICGRKDFPFKRVSIQRSLDK